MRRAFGRTTVGAAIVVTWAVACSSSTGSDSSAGDPVGAASDGAVAFDAAGEPSSDALASGADAVSEAATGRDGGSDALVDASVVDSSHPLAQTQACEAQLATEWAATPPSSGMGAAAARGAYEAVMRQLMSDYQVPAGAVSVTKDGKLVLALGIGMADREAVLPARFDDRYRIASMSKQLTSAAVLRLVEEGKLGLDDLAMPILSSLAPLPGKTVNPALSTLTVRHLLQHRGGWNRDFEAVGDPMFSSQTISSAFGIAGPADVEHVIRYMLDKPVTYTPGAAYCYSNFGYALLGRIIEQKSGMSYGDYVTANVLTPVGATHTALGASLLSGRLDGEVRYYDYPSATTAPSVFPNGGSVPWPYGGFFLEAMDSHGGWVSTPADMLKFALAVDGHSVPSDILSAQSLTAMTADPQVPSCAAAGGTTPASSSIWYGFGWQANAVGNLWHTGSLPGTATEDVIANSANGYAWSVFFNTRPAAADAFASRVDGDLWTALSNALSAGGFGGADDFDQVGDPSTWMSDVAYAAYAATADQAGRYPSRVEGRENGGVREYRGAFVTRHPAAQTSAAVGLDCVDFVAEDAAAQGAGQRMVTVHTFVDGAGVRRFQASWATP